MFFVWGRGLRKNETKGGKRKEGTCLLGRMSQSPSSPASLTVSAHRGYSSSAPEVQFSPEQEEAFQLYKHGKNVFITGPGGTGKTMWIRSVYSDARKRGRKVQICALTGCAAMLIGCGARTVHSWSGIRLGTDTIEKTIATMSSRAKKNWKSVDVLVIDEVSMMSSYMFDMLDAIAREFRKRKDVPFGGLQIIMSGDFFQLPPIGSVRVPRSGEFCFQSANWWETFPASQSIELKTIYRQSDPVYQEVLNQIRRGVFKRKTYNLLMEHVTRFMNMPEEERQRLESEFRPTKLFATREKVNNVNMDEMAMLEGAGVVYEVRCVKDDLVIAEAVRQRKLYPSDVTPEKIFKEWAEIEKTAPCEHSLLLKVGAQVMCTVNISDETGRLILCNGSQGRVVSFSESGFPVVKFRGGLERMMVPHPWVSEVIPSVAIEQVPLILAWAMTIHKSQGATMDVAEVDVGADVFENGQIYVALSRVKSLEGLRLRSLDLNKLKVHPLAVQFYNTLENKQMMVEEEGECVVCLDVKTVRGVFGCMHKYCGVCEGKCTETGYVACVVCKQR